MAEGRQGCCCNASCKQEAFDGGTLIGTQLPGKRRARHELPAQVLAPARSRRSQAEASQIDATATAIGPALAVVSRADQRRRTRIRVISAREPARNIAAAGIRIPEV